MRGREKLMRREEGKEVEGEGVQGESGGGSQEKRERWWRMERRKK